MTRPPQVIRCPVCGSPCGDPPLFTYTVERAALHFCPPWRNRERHERFLRCIAGMWPDGTARIRCCGACGFSFGDPFVGGNETFYRILHEQMGYPTWRWDYDVALHDPLIARLKGGRVLDIGAGSGAFLRHLPKGWERHAVESSDLTREQLRAAEIPAHASLEDPELEALNGGFDLVTLFQVLEHVAEFDALLHRCRELLKPGGVIFITVPDGHAMAEQERMTGCPDMPPNHINRWSPGSLALALRSRGFTPGEAVREPPSWGKVAQNLYLAVLADAARPHSFAAHAYQIRNKSLRTPLLRMAGALALFPMLRHGGKLRQGGAFGLTALRSAG